MHKRKAVYRLAKLGTWLAPIVIIAAWLFAALLQFQGKDYAWVVFIQAGMATLVLVPCWIISSALAKATDLKSSKGEGQ